MGTLRDRVATSPVAPIAAIPARVAMAGRHDARVIGRSVRWLANSREHTNLTYDLEPLNREHLAWWVAEVAGCSVAAARSYFGEVDSDRDLRRHLELATETSARRRLTDPPRYGKRVAWYALTRHLRPNHIVETGTDKGLGSVIFAAALLRNGIGRLTTMDVNPHSGLLIGGAYATVIDHVIGDSLQAIASQATRVDLFIHDSLHTEEHEAAEYQAVEPHLSPHAVVMSDNAHVTAALPQWSERHDRRYLHFQEAPADHWYPGGGSGASVPR